MYDVITIGSATKDFFLNSKEFRYRRVNSGLDLCLGFGSKVEMDYVNVETGGGGTNTAASFSRLGLRTAFVGKVGKDTSGRHVIEEMKEMGVSTTMVSRSRDKTGHAAILCGRGGERTILIYRGANNDFESRDIPWRKLKTKWFYITSLHGKSAGIIKSLMKYAKRNRIKVAMNPGYKQVKKRSLLKNLDILIMNRREVCGLLNMKWDEKKIFKKLARLTDGIVVITAGKKGAAACDGKYIYNIPAYKIRVVNSTGAGDAFGSAFTAAVIKKHDITYALQLATENAASVIQRFGAKKGLISRKKKRPLKVGKRLL